MVVSAKGTRLNRRGLETRVQIIDVSISCLAEASGGEMVSANSIVKRAGVTWGTVQHQFGDVDGLWAAVLEHVLDVWQPMPAPFDVPASLDGRISVIIERFWKALGFREARAIENLRTMLPGAPEDLESAYPRTASAIAAWEGRWARAYREAFEDLDVDEVKLRRVLIFLRGALRGMWSESKHTDHIDMEEGKRGLVEALVAYLQ